MITAEIALLCDPVVLVETFLEQNLCIWLMSENAWSSMIAGVEGLMGILWWVKTAFHGSGTFF